MRSVHRQGGHGLQHGDADALQLGFAFCGVENQRGVDDDISQATWSRACLHMRHLEKQVFLLTRAVKSVGTQAALLQRRDHAVQPERVVRGENGVVDGNCYCFDSIFSNKFAG